MTYQYISPELKVFACKIYFPGSFDGRSLFGIINTNSQDNVELYYMMLPRNRSPTLDSAGKSPSLTPPALPWMQTKCKCLYNGLCCSRVVTETDTIFHSLIQQFLRDRKTTECLYFFYCNFHYSAKKTELYIVKSID